MLDLEAALNDQPCFNSSFMEALGYCFNLETLDLAGSNDISDDGFNKLFKAQITVGSESVKPGLKFLHTLKLSGSGIGEAVIPNLIKTIPNLEHLEIIKCEQITEHGLSKLISELPKLTYLDISSIPIVKSDKTCYGFMD